MTRGEVIERMARAIHSATMQQFIASGVTLLPEWEQMSKNARRDYSAQAEAALEASGLWPYRDMEFVPIEIGQLRSIHGRFQRLVKMGQATWEQWEAMSPEMRELRHAIFGEADFGAIFAGQWLPDERGAMTEQKSRNVMKLKGIGK